MERFRHIKDQSFSWLTRGASFIVIIFFLTTFVVLIISAWPAIQRFGAHFFYTTTWDPVREQFGAASSLFGTVVVTAIALTIAVPISFGIAVFVTEIAPNALKGPISGAIELLAAIPSIVYGMWGLFTLVPIMSKYVEPALQNTLGTLPGFATILAGTPRGVDLLTTGVILSIMIMPFVASIARDSFNLTPIVVKEAAYALGGTRWDVVWDVVFPYTKFGVIGGIILAMGRALGETMAVAFVLGNKHAIPSSLFEAAATITVTLANEFTEADSDIYLSSLFYLALVLFTMSFLALAVARFMLRRKAQDFYQ